MNKTEILLIESELELQKLLNITLRANGYNVSSVFSANDGLKAAAIEPPDLIILDIDLYDEDGLMNLRKLREWYFRSVIILTLQDQETENIKALNEGANDYLVKPFRISELLEKIWLVMHLPVLPEENIPIIEFNNLKFDLSARTVKKNQQLIKLTAREYLLLLYFVKNTGQVLTNQFLLREIWGPGYIFQTQYLRAFVAQLRKKIENDPNSPECLINEFGFGYRFVASS
jgi:two-component system, OmpR family, KDP operon response regulator KdpE